MNELSGKKVDLYANVIFIIVSVIFGIALIRHLTNSVDKANWTQDQGVRAGTKISLQGVNWSHNKQTVILALKPDCPYCEMSALFYQQLSRERNKDTHLIALLPNSVSDSQTYIDKLGISVDEIKNVSLKSIGITKTPTIMLVDDTGIVKGVWVGKLSINQEIEVLNHLNGNPRVAGGDHLAEVSEYTVQEIDAESLSN